MEKTELKHMHNLFKTSNETPYREFREAMKQEYDNFYDIESFSQETLSEFYEKRIKELIGTFNFDPPERTNIDMYKHMHVMEMTFIYLFPETLTA